MGQAALEGGDVLLRLLEALLVVVLLVPVLLRLGRLELRVLFAQTLELSVRGVGTTTITSTTSCAPSSSTSAKR